MGNKNGTYLRLVSRELQSCFFIDSLVPPMETIVCRVKLFGGDCLQTFSTPRSYIAVLRLYDMNGIFQMQGGKNRIYRNRSMQTGSSGTLIGWKSGQTTFVPLWDRMEGPWLRTLSSSKMYSNCSVQ